MFGTKKDERESFSVSGANPMIEMKRSSMTDYRESSSPFGEEVALGRFERESVMIAAHKSSTLHLRLTESALLRKSTIRDSDHQGTLQARISNSNNGHKTQEEEVLTSLIIFHTLIMLMC